MSMHSDPTTHNTGHTGTAPPTAPVQDHTAPEAFAAGRYQQHDQPDGSARRIPRWMRTGCGSPRWLRPPASLRGRVVAGTVALLVVLLVGLFVAVDAALATRLNADLRTRLTDRTRLAEQLDGALSPQQIVDRLRGDGVTAVLCSPDNTNGAGTATSTATRNSDTASANGGQCVTADPAPAGGANGAGTAAGPPDPAARGKKAHPGGPAAPATVQRNGSELYVRTTLPVSGQTLTLAVDASQVGATMNKLIVYETISGLLGLLLALLLLLRIVGAALRPLDTMTALARDITAGDRGRRLRTGRPDTELGRNTTAFDAMLDELETALAAAAAAEARLRGFLSDVSHELRTLLTGLRAITETLLRDEGSRAERETAYVQLIRETQRAGRLVDDLLTMARLDTGMSLDLEPVDLTNVLTQEAERTRQLAPHAAISVHIDNPPRARPPAVQADPVRLGQILTNLLDNARRAAGPTGTITIHAARHHDTWQIDTTDSGPGIPEQHQEAIFNRLVRLDPSRSRHTGGFGLGLPIARALARAHGGELSCTPPLTGTGAQLRLTLPAATADPSTQPNGATPPATATAGA